MKKILRNLTDPDFLIKHSKVIGLSIGAGLIVCLVFVFILTAKDSAKPQVVKKDAVEKRIQENIASKEKADKEQQQAILSQSLQNSFVFEKLKYKTPDTTKLSNAFINTTDLVLDANNKYMLFQTVENGLYTYNIENGKKGVITQVSIAHYLADGKVYYVEIEDKIGTRLMEYDLNTQEKEEVTNLTYSQNVGGVATSDNVVYYILVQNGKSYLTAVNMSPESDITYIHNLMLELPTGSVLKQDGKDVYLINGTGFYKVIQGKLQKTAALPNYNFQDVKIWNHQPLLYAYDAKASISKIIYQGKVILQSNNVFEMFPIDDTYLLVNDGNKLKIINKDTLTFKLVSSNANNSVVVNGNIIFSQSVDAHDVADTNEPEGAGYYFYYEKQ
ncbi:hypothetical protein [Priestia megaterium]|uniref:hypothetical protein n=1 Tax=Priestia megaterium TaxID=1404 RepID=UPI00310146DC